MIEFNHFTGLFSSVLFLLALFSLSFPFGRWPVTIRCVLSVLWIALMAVPIGSVSVAAFVRSFIGDLSIPSLVILVSILHERALDGGAGPRKEMDLFCLLLLPVALVFYPLALGLGKYDPYALGYGSLFLLVVSLLIALTAWATERWLIASCLSLAVLGHALGLYESNNLWDYLFDPLLVVYAAGLAVFYAVSEGRIRFRRVAEEGPER